MNSEPYRQGLLRRTIAAAQARVAIARKAGSFAAVGVVNATIDFAVFWTATHAWDWPKIPANVLAWMVAVSASYVMNSYFTFAVESGRKLRWRSYVTFAASGVAGMVANTAALVVGDRLLSLLLADADLRLAVAKLGAIGVSFLVNFTLSHMVVFRPAVPPAGKR